MRLSDYIERLRQLQAYVGPYDPRVVVQRHSDLQDIGDRFPELTRVIRKPGQSWLTRFHKTMPPEAFALSELVVEVAEGN